MNGKKILVADDEYVARVVIRDRLLAEGFEIVEAESGEEAVEAFRDESPDLVLMDVNFGQGMNGFEATRKIKDLAASGFVPVILCTVREDVESKKIGLDYGADDYVTKPFDPTELVVRVRSMLRIRDLAENNDKLIKRNLKLKQRQKKLKEENKELRSRLVWPDVANPIVGEGPAMQGVFRFVEKIVPTSEPILITGETGAGKEMIARLIHHNGDRRERPILFLDCPAIPDSLFESELFGHRKGAFSGAFENRKGILSEGDGTTVVLDEIGELPLGIQAKLLRFLQDSTVRPIGSNRSHKVDVHIIAATNRDLEGMMASGEFRKDLYYRLSVLRIHVPPLRERPEDIPALAQCFLAQFNEKHSRKVKGFMPEALGEIKRISYAGNIRELKNLVVSSAILVSNNEAIGKRHITEALAHFATNVPSSGSQDPVDLKSVTRETERRTIEQALERFRNDRSRTAKALGITRQGLWKKMRRLGFFD